MNEWIDVGLLADIPLRGARTIPVTGGESIALFRTGDDRLFALIDRCPHKHGPLSQGIVHGRAVTCPLHSWNIDLTSGEPTGADRGKGDDLRRRGRARRQAWIAPPVPVEPADREQQAAGHGRRDEGAPDDVEIADRGGDEYDRSDQRHHGPDQAVEPARGNGLTVHGDIPACSRNPTASSGALPRR